jgi:hypothetical protein
MPACRVTIQSKTLPKNGSYPQIATQSLPFQIVPDYPNLEPYELPSAFGQPCRSVGDLRTTTLSQEFPAGLDQTRSFTSARMNVHSRQKLAIVSSELDSQLRALKSDARLPRIVSSKRHHGLNLGNVGVRIQSP